MSSNKTMKVCGPVSNNWICPNEKRTENESYIHIHVYMDDCKRVEIEDWKKSAGEGGRGGECNIMVVGSTKLSWISCFSKTLRTLTHDITTSSLSFSFHFSFSIISWYIILFHTYFTSMHIFSSKYIMMYLFFIHIFFIHAFIMSHFLFFSKWIKLNCKIIWCVSWMYDFALLGLVFYYLNNYIRIIYHEYLENIKKCIVCLDILIFFFTTSCTL